MMYDRDGHLLPDRQLMSLDMTGERAKAAIAVGNVDTAQHVAVFTPGMNSTVDGNMSDYVKDMKNISARAEQELRFHGDGGTVAGVTYLGYEPPKVEDTNSWNSGFITGCAAHDGADKLAKFYEGINDSRGVA